MESEQRLIVCCNYRAHSNEEKGQAIALYEKDKDSSRLSKINMEKYFSDTEDCEVHIIPNPGNDHDYSFLQSRYADRLYLIQCVENKNIEDGSNYAKNKSNLYKIEAVEPRAICEIIESELPDEVLPEIRVNSSPLTRHIFLQGNSNTFGPFEYNMVQDEENNQFTLTLKKPNDIKYLGKILPRLAILRYENSKLEEYIDDFYFPKKLINNNVFKHKFISNVQELRNVDCDQINYGFMDELSKTVGIIVKETNTKGITENQITMLSARIKSKRHKFTFDTDYVFKQLSEASKFEKVITEVKSELKDLMFEQALKENEQIKSHFIALLKSDENIINDVKEKIRFEQQAELSKLEQLKSALYDTSAELNKTNQEIQDAKLQKAEIDKDKENRAIEQLRQKQTELNDSIALLENKKTECEEKYKGVFKLDLLSDELNQLESKIQGKKAVYDDKLSEVRKKEAEVLAQKEELKELTEKSAEHYKKELLSVKNSIDVLSQVEQDVSIIEFPFVSKEGLCSIGMESQLHDYIKYVQYALSEHKRNMSVEHVINYLVSIDTSFITILSGLPGTGKTSLVTILMSQILKSRFNNVQVGRGWSSERDLLGYFNPITNTYISSGSGMYEFLDGIENDERLNMVLLDEANLSPIEHYWSKFMGQTDSFEQREISITNQKSIKLNGNLRFIATINNDMTTEPLSPRLIDRAPCIRLDVYSLMDEGSKSGLDIIDNAEVERLKNIFDSSALNYETFQKAIKGCVCENQQLEQMLEVIEQIRTELNQEGADGEKFGARVHISERRNQVVKTYLERSLGLYAEFRNKAVEWLAVNKSSYFLDFAISQFILPLISGHGKNFKNRVIHLQELLTNIQQTHNYELPIALELVTRMVNQGEEDLDTYDFMSLR